MKAIIIMTSSITITKIVLTLLTLTFPVTPQLLNNLTATLITYNNSSYTMVTNNLPNPAFVQINNPFDCSLSPLFSYNQTNAQYLNNTAYSIMLQGIYVPTTISFSSVHNNLNLTYQPTSCQGDCVIIIQNNCPPSINFGNYFDRVTLNISGYPQILSYYVKCNSQYLSNTFQWGLVIQIVFITILSAVGALYSQAWSLGGLGVNINIWLIIAFNLIIIIGAIIGYFSNTALVVILDVITFILGIVGVGICINELLFLLRLKFLALIIFKIRTFQFRVLQSVSLILAAGLLVGWWYSEDNIILNDIINICLIVACIKILKFTSLLIPTLGFAITMSLLIIIGILIYYVTGISYNSLFINDYNYPLEMQVPTINPVYYQKCAWLPINSLAYPGMLLSFLRRFDSSRNTTLYLILATITFFIGGVAWMFISIASPVNLPFGLVSQPCMIGLVCIFAYRRRQLGVLWRGQFYDPQFRNKQDLKATIEMVEHQSNRDSTLVPQLLESTKRNGSQKERESQISQASDAIRSKFMKKEVGISPS